MLKESPMGFTLYAPSGEILRRSNTLRGLIDYERRSPVCSVHLARDVSPRVVSLYPYAVQVFYEDGARGESDALSKRAPMPTTYQNGT